MRTKTKTTRSRFRVASVLFLDRVQWAQRAPRLARERAAAEKRTRELVERWGHPLEALRLEAAAGG